MHQQKGFDVVYVDHDVWGLGRRGSESRVTGSLKASPLLKLHLHGTPRGLIGVTCTALCLAGSWDSQGQGWGVCLTGPRRAAMLE